VAATDSTFASASFGLARVYVALGDRDQAIAALERVPKSSAVYVSARIALCRVLCAEMAPEVPSLPDLSAASDALAGLTLENSVRLSLVRDLHLQALAMLVDGREASSGSVVLVGAPLDEESQRSALERTYRSLAKLAHTEEERWSLVDEANSCRPRTLT
jgi:serine/threonine-protein kinase PknG